MHPEAFYAGNISSRPKPSKFKSLRLMDLMSSFRGLRAQGTPLTLQVEETKSREVFHSQALSPLQISGRFNVLVCTIVNVILPMQIK